LRTLTLDGMELIVSRTGWSSELGYEIYLQDGSRGSDLWDSFMSAGKPFGLKPGHTSTIRRIEGGMLSYHADMDNMTNPFELGLDRLVALDSDADFIGKTALSAIRDKGITRKQIGLIIEGEAFAGPNTSFWPVICNESVVGRVTSAVYSPRLEKNIAMAMIELASFDADGVVSVKTSSGLRSAHITGLPFYDPSKNLAKG
ncbi:MAG: glycine cleavage T C-terminal barrel domain-containing protein, partial [Alphaproteobacteria bacterium]|nr:glycine cleavage T C-terminal barrel domain-containing protein [Alphaproteobacteria bacterium]